jgi:O-antigen/teichoic acid export membrane protein
MDTNHEIDFAKVTLKGTAWSYLSVFSGKFLVFVSTIILARLLTKSDFGVVGYAFIVTSFLDALNGLGIGPALIYHEAEPETANTAFWLGLVVGCGLFIITWLIAPLIGDYFNDARAVPVVRAMVLVYPINALGNINQTYLAKNLKFKKKFIPEIVYATSKGIISVGLAVMGFGYWSQVWGQVVSNAVMVAVSRMVYPWNPKFIFSKKIAKSMLRYGLNIVALDSLANLLNNADYLLIGHYLGAEALGVYTLGFRVPEMVLTQFARIVSDVIFPVFVKMKGQVATLNNGFVKSLKYLSMITMPFGIGIALVAKPLVLALFTEKWSEAIPVIRAIAIYALLLSLFRTAGSFYKAQGKPEILTYLTLVRLALLLPALWYVVTALKSIEAVGWVQAIVALLSGVVSLIVASKIFNLKLNEILIQFFPAALSSAIMAAACLTVLYLTQNFSTWLQLGLVALTGIIIYIGVLRFLDPRQFIESWSMLVKVVKRG